jgi:cystathionine beta-lyase
VLGYNVPPAPLREALVERLHRLYGWRVEPDWVVFVSGVVPGLHLAARHLVAPEQHVIVPKPVYQHLRRAPELAGRAFSEVPLLLSNGRWVWDEDALAGAVRAHSRLLMLCNPQNPGGTIFTRNELSRLAAFAEKHDLVICSDEIHAEILLDEGKPHVPIASLSRETSRRTVTLLSPNKAFGFPGAGCAFAVIEDPQLRRAFSSDHHATVHDASVFGYEAALAAYRDCDDWLGAQIAYLRGNRDLVEREIAATPNLKMAHVEATYLAWIDASALGAVDPQKHFLDHGVAMSPGSQFGDARFVRLNFGTQRARLAEALKRISSASRQSPRG